MTEGEIPRTAARELRATYRVQMHGAFRLAEAFAIVPYLDRLGISHLYTSPVLAARAGSTHGYDVTDPCRLNPELGDDGERQRLVEALHARGMGWLLDIVPNHMAASTENPYWRDVLRHGRASRWAGWFDIDWNVPRDELRGRVMLPVLGARLPELLARHEIDLAWEDEGGGVVVRYWENRFPVDPVTIPWALSLGLESERERATGDAARALDELEERLERLAALPLRTSSVAGAAEQRRRESGAALAALQELVEREPVVRAQVERSLERFAAGEVGPTRMRRFLDLQPYDLVFWRRAANEINYRRFFNINELVALSMEDEPVFDETHGLVLAWIADGSLDGLRLDHVDGLRDPLGYLRRLRSAVDARRGGGARARLPILVEKILSAGEHLRREWPVEGTTGYEVLNDLEAALIDALGFGRLEQSYRAMLRLDARGIGFERIARESKRKVLRGSLTADVKRLVRLMLPIIRRDPRTRTLGAAAVESAIVETIAALPVYRTYVDAREPPATPDDAMLVDRALNGARRDSQQDERLLALLREVLLLQNLDVLPEVERRERWRFVSRFQQASGPAAAKGVEDTALYLYHPLASRNEVGAEPERPLHDAVDTLHRANLERLGDWPRALVTTSTHDTKRGADTRARLDVLSELPDEWWRLVATWRRRHAPLRRRLGRRVAPDPNTEYLLYQSMAGIWPAEAARHTLAGAPLDDAVRTSLRERLSAYMVKAVREGKSRSGWVDQEPEFEAALTAFVEALLDDARCGPFLSELAQLVARMAAPGYWNALSRTLLHLTVPGVPDVYQGDELWSFTLVDPDNRRPVDYAARTTALDELETRFHAGEQSRRSLLGELVHEPDDGRIKLFLLWRALQLRRRLPLLFERGSYERVRAEGTHAEHVLAFTRGVSGGEGALLVVVPRLTVALSAGAAPLGEPVWGTTSLALPRALAGAEWWCAFSGRRIGKEPGQHPDVEGGRENLRMGTLLAEFPVALLSSDGPLGPGRLGADVG